MPRRGDRDSQDDGPILTLQRALHDLGFELVGEADGVFGRMTEAAVRELQIAAAHHTVATLADGDGPRGDLLRPVDNTERIILPADGDASDDVLELVRVWRERGWVNPVTVESWLHDGPTPTTLDAERVWHHEEVTESSPRVFVRDVSGRHEVPDHHLQRGRSTLGYRAPGGPNMTHAHAWPETEVTTSSMLGVAWEDADEDVRSTFRVIRAVAEQECLGYADVVNGWDNAVVSTGPCHWTLALGGDSNDPGELAGLLTWFAARDPEAYGRTFGDTDLGVADQVVQGTATVDPAAPQAWPSFAPRSRKHVRRLTLPGPDGETVAVDGPATAWFRTFAWQYRFVMAARTEPGWRRAMWEWSCHRIADVLDTPLGEELAAEVELPAEATLGNVATSEVAAALLLRWHVRGPGDFVSTQLRATAGSAVRAAGPGAAVDDDAQARFVEELLVQMGRERSTDFEQRMRDVVAVWPRASRGNRGWDLDVDAVGPLDPAAGSLRLADVTH